MPQFTHQFTHQLHVTQNGKKVLIDKYTNLAAAQKIKGMIDTAFNPEISAIRQTEPGLNKNSFTHIFNKTN